MEESAGIFLPIDHRYGHELVNSPVFPQSFPTTLLIFLVRFYFIQRIGGRSAGAVKIATTGTSFYSLLAN